MHKVCVERVLECANTRTKRLQTRIRETPRYIMEKTAQAIVAAAPKRVLVISSLGMNGTSPTVSPDLSQYRWNRGPPWNDGGGDDFYDRVMRA